MDTPERGFMRRALALAEKSAGLASPNPPVGCVIVRGDRVVGEGWHEYATRDHAEVRALAMSGSLARGADVYVTLEPCCHYGRTPPCVTSLIAAGVSRVLVAHLDPNPKVSGRGIAALRSAGIEVVAGLSQAKASRLIEAFACHVTTGLPLVVGKAGMSLDGRIAAAGRPSGWISSVPGRGFGQRLRWELDALLVGVGTVLADDPQLTYRGRVPKGRPLLTAILDSQLRTPLNARVFTADAAERRILLFCAPDAPHDRKRRLEGLGAEICPVARSPRGLDLNQVVRRLGERDILSVLVEGGSEIHWSFLSANLIDKFYFIIAPIVLGGKDAVPLAGGAGYASADAAPRFRISRRRKAGLDMILEAYPCYSRSILSPWRLGASGSAEPGSG